MAIVLPLKNAANENYGTKENIGLAKKCLFYRVDQFFHRHIHKNVVQCDAAFPAVIGSVKDLDIPD